MLRPGHKAKFILIESRFRTSPSPRARLAKPASPGTIGASRGMERNMPERAANLRADLILKAMIAVAPADAGGIEDSEISLMQQVYQDQAKRPITPQEIAEVAEAA